MSQEIFAKLTNSLVEGDPDATYEATKEALAAGIEPMVIIKEGLIPGMNIVGEKFSCGEYFLPDLIIAADGMQKAMTLLEPELLKRQQAIESAGTVLLGTVKGDIHEIGKSLVATMLTANGFKVHDLGVDVPTETFVAKVKEMKPDILGLSALLTTTMVMQREVIRALQEAGIRDQVKVMVGGAPVTRSWAEEIGADGYAEDAMGAVQVARQLLGK
ncbi:MAG: corrinoid protein [Anaerolineales bacterium]|nr:corrinoid protein [Anaerolineales bacterium]MCS7247093.1 corrinoid protein [Anaerolineales bacterium]MDW8160904.1 corrinoid protein [Anaerolineales bacterium]MDW8447056.1 corrinoid protein [Anaerolineales bacterium]